MQSLRHEFVFRPIDENASFRSDFVRAPLEGAEIAVLKAMVITTLIPLARNNGVALAQDELDAILGEIVAQFGRITIQGETQGIWRNEGTTFHDRCLKITISLEREKYEEVKLAIIQIGRKLEQIAM